MNMEQRLIDANALYTTMKQEWLDDNGIVDVLCVIDAMPTVDAVPVVRCKDCLWRHDDSSQMWLPCMERETPDDWFCADGKRKSND